eukprot:scaffold2975_cov248-Pinguiococcus_pyrenoidosus.AAC.2
MILFQSVEIETSPETLRALVDHLDLDDGDLVVGVAIQGHEFKPGTNVLTGRTTPWNTLALWNTQELAKTGFLGVAEGWVGRGRATHPWRCCLRSGLALQVRTVGDEGETVIAGGVEEVTAISAAQSLSPSRRARAKLLKVPGITWETQFKVCCEALPPFSFPLTPPMLGPETKTPQDAERRAWHERKMRSKLSRAQAQLSVLKLPTALANEKGTEKEKPTSRSNSQVSLSSCEQAPIFRRHVEASPPHFCARSPGGRIASCSDGSECCEAATTPSLAPCPESPVPPRT